MQTTIGLEKKTRSRLREIGRMNDTYDIVVNRIIDAYINKTQAENARTRMLEGKVYHLRQEVARLNGDKKQ